MYKRVGLLIVSGLLFSALPVSASSIAVRLGRFSPRGQSQLWLENADTFNIVPSDFASLAGGVEFGLEVSEFFDVTIGVDGYSRGVVSSYADYLRDDGTEIVQDHRLTVAPVTGGVRFNPAGKFHALVPYVAGGGGLYPYEYREEGEFIDFNTFDIFGDVFIDRGVGVGAYGAAGLEVALSRGFTLFGEFRQHWVRAEHNEDFLGFGDFDLNARQVSFGFTVRF